VAFPRELGVLLHGAKLLRCLLVQMGEVKRREDVVSRWHLVILSVMHNTPLTMW
jgi:hypothetical protein